MNAQTCNVCQTNKPLDAFEKQTNRPSRRRTCKPCRYGQRDRAREQARHREYMRERRVADPDAVRMNWERSKYGACKEDIGVTACMICGGDNRLCIDHDHVTGEIRGILCTPCNAGIGMLRDSQELLIKAADYLKDGPHWQLPFAKYPK